MTAKRPPDQVVVFDTTLRDGEQSPGCSMTVPQKLRMARTLADMGADVIEAGFAAASPQDFDAVREVARAVKGATICSLARCHPGDIQAAAAALEPAERKRLHVFIATSPIHRKHKLKLSKAEVLARAVEGVRVARSLVDDVEFSAEDAIRSEPKFLAEVMAAVVAAGATTFNVPDTVGYTTPGEMGRLIVYLRERLPQDSGVVLSAHCHDDLGMAVANSLAAVRAGARQVECTINGIGERAGNCALEELVMALKTRSDYFGVETAIDTRKLYPASRQLAAIIGSFVPSNKAIVGDNAFAHEAGIHQHGMLANRETYEIMRPEDVGISRSTLVLGKHSGRHALADRVRELGFALSDPEMEQLFGRFKALADRKRQVFDADIEALVAGEQRDQGGPWSLDRLHISSGMGEGQLPTAGVAMTGPDGKSIQEAAVGDGPVDAALKAMARATATEFELVGMRVRSVSEGEDAQGEAALTARIGNVPLSGRAVDTDIVAACAQAFLDILNRAQRRQTAPASSLPPRVSAAI
ncbi:MAG: 2-isopropylmalate synthase [Gammaproteobacteria bacterium]|jgi:2-isopropylmalate synthase|nr:2-isopropylmalate synthase [Gammaproteobacteria bacterium]